MVRQNLYSSIVASSHIGAVYMGLLFEYTHDLSYKENFSHGILLGVNINVMAFGGIFISTRNFNRNLANLVLKIGT